MEIKGNLTPWPMYQEDSENWNNMQGKSLNLNRIQINYRSLENDKEDQTRDSIKKKESDLICVNISKSYDIPLF